MKCRHRYYRRVDGVLYCVQCGEPAGKAPDIPIEDKAQEKHEDKKRKK